MTVQYQEPITTEEVFGQITCEKSIESEKKVYPKRNIWFVWDVNELKTKYMFCERTKVARKLRRVRTTDLSKFSIPLT